MKRLLTAAAVGALAIGSVVAVASPAQATSWTYCTAPEYPDLRFHPGTSYTSDGTGYAYCSGNPHAGGFNQNPVICAEGTHAVNSEPTYAGSHEPWGDMWYISASCVAD